jgi:hypothetical protein
VDPEEFWAFQDWRVAIQEAEGAEEWEQGGCALGAIALLTSAAALWMQVQKAKEGMGAQRGRLRENAGRRAPDRPPRNSIKNQASAGVVLG